MYSYSHYNKMHTKLHPPDPSFNPRSRNSRPVLPEILCDALSIRMQVFVDEQGCSAENEVDEDDARSWHWVIYEDETESGIKDGSMSNANANANASANARGQSKAIGTVRLVPPSSSPQGTTSSDTNPNSNPDFASACGTHSASGTGTHTHTDTGYVKITRVAVLPAYRGRGIGRHLVETAVEWAGDHAAAINGAESGATTAINGDGDQRTVQGTVQRTDQTGPAGQGAEEWTGLILVHAQVDVEGMYARLGFERDEGMGRWMEEGIEHVGMWRKL